MSEPTAIGAKQEITYQRVGGIFPIELPQRELGEFLATLGEKVAEGDCGTIFQVKEQPNRHYKLIPAGKFQNGDEVRISEIAGRVGVAPAYYGAFTVNPRNQRLVVIEMEHGGKTLGNWMEDLYVEPERVEEDAKAENALPPEVQAIIEEIKAKSRFQVTVIEKKPRTTVEEAIDQMYARPEQFYIDLFSHLKTLAENRIAYGDIHVGNILPKPVMRLIDFDGASIEASVSAAARKTLGSAYTFLHFKNFTQLKDLSADSKDLIQWFSNLPREVDSGEEFPVG